MVVSTSLGGKCEEQFFLNFFVFKIQNLVAQGYFRRFEVHLGGLNSKFMSKIHVLGRVTWHGLTHRHRVDRLTIGRH
jgi:hypothetical protein